MFKLIEQEIHPFQKPLIDSFIKIIKQNNSLGHFFKNNTTAKFILTEDTSTGIFGGALLLKQKFAFLHKDIRKSLSSVYQENEAWTCAVSLCIGNNDVNLNIEQICKTFYLNLYKKLLEFGLKEKINFLCMVLEPGEYLSTEAMGFWPYVVEIRPQDSFDGLFHGILSLTSSHLSINNWREDLSESTKLAA